jgi:hypothetical protein
MFCSLAQLTRRILSAPATSAAVERAFSGGGLVLTDRRTNLKPSHINDILFVRSVQKTSLCS